MSAAEETLNVKEVSKRKSAPVVNRILDFLSSVRFGVTLLCVLVALSMVGMLVMQQNVNGFDAYYVSLTPAEKLVFGSLGIFDIYHSWYFNLLLLVLSLNIVLASIDRFPSAWSYIVKPKLHASKNWLSGRIQNERIWMNADSEQAIAERIKAVLQENRLKPRIAEHHGILYVSGESGKWNRIGAYIVHVALLTLFLGHFVANQTGFDADVRMVPGETTDQIQLIQFDLDKKEKFNVQLPFSMECTDIQQTLIDPNGSIDVTNTLDWRTQMKISDPEYGDTIADISMNKPFSYRGYRFFQAQTIPVGNARKISLELTPQAGGEAMKVDLARNTSADLPDGTKIQFEQFLPDFTFNAEGRPDTRSGEYNNPAAVLSVTPADGEKTRVFAFAGKVADNIPVGAPKAGYKWRLTDYEKSPLAHVLSIKYDPFNGAFIAWYFGGFGLIGALIFVFFISHKRIWAMIERRSDGEFEIILGGDANRNHLGFEDKFKKVVAEIRGGETAAN
jgi:cytochrome c biogenesis protein